MTKIIVKIFTFCLLLNSCSGQTGSGDSASIEIIENALTFELSFGDDNLPDDYLLAGPISIAVNEQNYIYVVDEDRIKIYDDAGNPVNIIGRPGHGPGEFFRSRSFSIGYSGYLSMIDSEGLSIFSPDHRFVSKENIRRNEKYKSVVDRKSFSIGTPVKALSFGENEKVVEFNGRNIITDSEHQRMDYLLSEKDGNISKITEYVNTSDLLLGGMGLDLSFTGAFLWTSIPEEKVVYLHPGHDKRFLNNQYLYKLTITSLDDFNSSTIEHPYSPVAIPDSVKNHYEDMSAILRTGPRSEIDEERSRTLQYLKDRAIEIIEENKYLPPVQSLLSDGNIIFTFTNSQNDAGETLVDVFDMTTDSFLRSAYFSIIPLTIKNGFAYRLSKSRDGFDIVEKYKIDPKVYH